VRGYEQDSVYRQIILDLAQLPPDSNEAVTNASKLGHPFRVADTLLYNRDNSGKERLVVPFSLIQDILRDVHDNKHHFGRERMMHELEGLHFRRKRHLVDEYVRKCY
jgi:hypothetical protein